MAQQIIRIPFDAVTVNTVGYDPNLGYTQEFDLTQIKGTNDALETAITGSSKPKEMLAAAYDCIHTKVGIKPLHTASVGTTLNLSDAVTAGQSFTFITPSGISSEVIFYKNSTNWRMLTPDSSGIFQVEDVGLTDIPLNATICGVCTDSDPAYPAVFNSFSIIVQVPGATTHTVRKLTKMLGWSGLSNSTDLFEIGPEEQVVDCLSVGTRLVIATKDTIYWSADEDFGDFTPSLITGAGSGTPQGLLGNVVSLEPCYLGFYIIASASVCIGSTQRGDINYPFTFSAIAKASGAIKSVSSVDNSRVFMVGNSGIYEITPTEAKSVYFGLWTELSKYGVPNIRLFMNRYLALQVKTDSTVSLCYLVDILDGYVVSLRNAVLAEPDLIGTNRSSFSYIYQYITSSTYAGFEALFQLNKATSYSTRRYTAKSGGSLLTNIITARLRLPYNSSFRVVKVRLLGTNLAGSSVYLTSANGTSQSLSLATTGESACLVEACPWVVISIAAADPYWIDATLTHLELTIVPNTGRPA